MVECCVANAKFEGSNPFSRALSLSMACWWELSKEPSALYAMTTSNKEGKQAWGTLRVRGGADFKSATCQSLQLSTAQVCILLLEACHAQTHSHTYSSIRLHAHAKVASSP